MITLRKMCCAKKKLIRFVCNLCVQYKVVGFGLIIKRLISVTKEKMAIVQIIKPVLSQNMLNMILIMISTVLA